MQLTHGRALLGWARDEASPARLRSLCLKLLMLPWAPLLSEAPLKSVGEVVWKVRRESEHRKCCLPGAL